MTLHYSDLYETFDSKFKTVVPKTHSEIIKLMEIYTDVNSNNRKKK